MPEDPRPLPEGTLLADRFLLGRVLGRGAFGIVYLATDLTRNDAVVVKELAPTGVLRDEQGIIRLPEATAHRLRQSFLEEARIVSRLQVPGVLPMRLGFAENGTAYFATDYLAHAQTLEKAIQVEGRFPVEDAVEILLQVLDILEAIHAKGILHRDIKPSNILLSPNGMVTVIDFGAAREWQADASLTHTVLFTPYYAPLEQMAERARRGPATDLFALSATVYEMLAGRKPETATDRASGIPLMPLMSCRPDLDEGLCEAIESGLALKMTDRPQSAAAFRSLLSGPHEPSVQPTLLEMDAKMVRLQNFTFERRQCPACNGLLDEPKPLRFGVCPVCHEGTIKRRDIYKARCPSCRNSTLRRVHNREPVHTCPTCHIGWLKFKKTLLGRDFEATCPLCSTSFIKADLGKEVDRSEFVWHCAECDAQLDECPDGRLKLIYSSRRIPHQSLYPEEWDCIAAGLEPGSGNSECMLCGADYYLDGDQITLLGTRDDPFEFARENLGRLLSLEDNRWMAVGKLSPHQGLICINCATEFDRDGDYLRLVRTSNKRLQSHLDGLLKLVDWHRIAQDLPTVNEEHEFATSLVEEIAKAYDVGEIGFDGENDVLWKGPARSVESGASGTLTISKESIQFGGIFRKGKLPFGAVRAATAEESSLLLEVSGEREAIKYDIEAVDLTIHLGSGRYTVELGASNLAARINIERSARASMA
jgi:serine/threonine protein kinase